MNEASFNPDAWQRDLILRNERERPGYAPYCMRCKGLVRMRVVEPHYWRCHCGAECDYREAKPQPKAHQVTITFKDGTTRQGELFDVDTIEKWLVLSDVDDPFSFAECQTVVDEDGNDLLAGWLA